MKSYTPFLKANRSLLLSLNSIKGCANVRVKADRQALPMRFARDLSLVVEKPIQVNWEHRGRPRRKEKQIIWHILPQVETTPCELDIKPLRERPEDVPALLKLFFGTLPLSAKERHFLAGIDWPGDLLQMQAVAQGKALRADADLRDLHAIPEDELAIANLLLSDEFGFWSGLVREKGLKGAADLLVEQLIVQQLHACGGNVSSAARDLMLPPTTLYSRINCRRKRLNAA